MLMFINYVILQSVIVILIYDFYFVFIVTNILVY